MTRCKRLLMAAGLSCLTAIAAPNLWARSPAVQAQPAVIPNAEQVDLASPQGNSYRIFIAAPVGEAPEGGYPVVYMLDGNSIFGTAVETARFQRSVLGPVVIVAIGYPIDRPLDGTRRFWDMTPVTAPEHIPGHFNPAIVTGGQDQFLDFIADQVKPLVESRFPIDTGRQTLFGHSLGGYFTLYTLFTRPELFQTYVAGSPSIWWNGRSVLRDLETFRQMPREIRNGRRLFVVIGQDELGHLVLDARNLITSLPPMQTKFEEIPAQGHVPMLPAAINSALNFALGTTR